MTLQTIGDDGPFQQGGENRGRRPGPWLIGCGVLLALLGIVVLLFMVRGESWIRGALAWSLQTVEQQVMPALPEDLTEGERRRLAAAFAAARREVRRAEELDAAALQQLRPAMMEVSRAIAAGKLTREQCLDLIEVLERLAGAASPGDPAAQGLAGHPLRPRGQRLTLASSSPGSLVLGVLAASASSAGPAGGPSWRPASQPAM